MSKEKVKFAKIVSELKKPEAPIEVPGGKLDDGKMTANERAELARLELKCLSANMQEFPTVREMMLLSTLRAKAKVQE